MASAAPTLKAALVTELAVLFPAPTTVAYGPPGNYLDDEVVSVTDVVSSSEVATLSPNRTREETLDVTVIFSVTNGGGYEAQQTVTERAYAMVADLENYLKVTDPTVGGTVRGNAGVVAHDMTESAPDGSRNCQIVVTVRAHARI